MISRHHPLFSPIAAVSTALFVLLLAGAVWLTGGRAFSPGALSVAAHHQVESGGFANHAAFGDDCLRCHRPFAGLAVAGCLDCHTGVATQQVAGSGLHGRILPDKCAACHQEHQGAEYDLYLVALNQFEPAHHELLFPLTGAHEPLACVICHQERHLADVPDTCLGCHEEPPLHVGLFGTSCSQCHGDNSWRPARLNAHTFPLDHGDEGPIRCADCHEDSFASYNCATCHESLEMGGEHDALNLTRQELFQCIECHPTGLVDEVKEARDG